MILLKNSSRPLLYLFIAVLTVLGMQSVVVVLHEFTHSAMAWVLGEMRNPLGIVWGNPLTMTGWDEGVDYSRIFSQGDGLRAALIGFCPLVMHAIFSGGGLFLMRRQWLFRKKWLFHATYWFVVVNFMELVAYVFMRAFSGHGDIGIFNRGLEISAWWVFIFGSAGLSWGIFLLYRQSLPALQSLFGRGNPAAMWAMLVFTSFLLFLWGSGIRVLMYVSGPQWMFGLIGVPAFILTLVFFRPRCC